MAQLQTESEETIQMLAQKICQNGWQDRFLIIINMIEPITLLLGQFIWVMQPFLQLLIAESELVRIGQLLEDPQMVQALKHRLEEK